VRRGEPAHLFRVCAGSRADGRVETYVRGTERQARGGGEASETGASMAHRCGATPLGIWQPVGCVVVDGVIP
jgi:hypothetical protein